MHCIRCKVYGWFRKTDWAEQRVRLTKLTLQLTQGPDGFDQRVAGAKLPRLYFMRLLFI